MATPFLKIYDLFLLLNQDERFLETLDVEQQEEILQSFLLKAIHEFYECKTELSYNLVKKEFDNELNSDEQYILAEYMKIYWIQRLLSDEKNLRLQLGDRDYKKFSPSNQLKTLMSLDETLNIRLHRRIIKYKNKSTLWGR